MHTLLEYEQRLSSGSIVAVVLTAAVIAARASIAEAIALVGKLVALVGNVFVDLRAPG